MHDTKKTHSHYYKGFSVTSPVHEVTGNVRITLPAVSSDTVRPHD